MTWVVWGKIWSDKVWLVVVVVVMMMWLAEDCR